MVTNNNINNTSNNDNNNDNYSNDNLSGLAQEAHCSSIDLSSRFQ